MNKNPLLPNLTWDIKEQKVLLPNNTPIGGYKCLVRSDNGNPIVITKESYSPLRNSEFVENLERISELSGMPIAGYNDFNDSRKVLGYLKNEDKNFKVCGYPMKDYVVHGNSHDGSSAIFFGTANNLIRCHNQWSLILKSTQVRVKHTTNKQKKLDLIIQNFEDYFKERNIMYANLERFGDIKVSQSVVDELVKKLMKTNEETDISTRKQNSIDDLCQSIEEEMSSLGDNMWGLFNGVTHYTTHKLNPKKGNVLGNFFNQQGDFNKKVYEFGLELIEERPALITV